MNINVNGQNYDDWASVPPDVRATLAATLPDADRNGIPDLFETGALPPGTQGFTTATIQVNDQVYSSVDDLPPEVQQSLRQAFGWMAATGVTPSPVAATGATGEEGSGAPRPATPLSPGQIMLNGVPTSVEAAGTEKKSWWRRLIGS